LIKKLKVKKYVGSNKKVNEDTEKRVSITKSLTTFQIYLKRRHKAEGTREDYNRDLLQFLSFLAEQLDVRVRYIDNITKANIREYEDYLLDRNLSGEYKVNTVCVNLKLYHHIN
jgi:site-specific recombinase XerD